MPISDLDTGKENQKGLRGFSRANDLVGRSDTNRYLYIVRCMCCDQDVQRGLWEVAGQHQASLQLGQASWKRQHFDWPSSAPVRSGIYLCIKKFQTMLENISKRLKLTQTLFTQR